MLCPIAPRLNCSKSVATAPISARAATSKSSDDVCHVVGPTEKPVGHFSGNRRKAISLFVDEFSKAKH